ncbi:sulfite exporter TauE/SafE family protein [uncultured Roseobacter sp.]|uniref:sulfite exporter TauE/SafE family protein n=1 Tax=uncultured Roseobacter sp. TaxID=114847 RepID=UPI00262EFEA1|nr:sulfite exporter TauE/SafE family protein [uncultured Roseobacter sp.]
MNLTLSTDLALSFYGVAALSILLTGISKSGFGGGLGVMAVPLMSLFVAPQFAAAVMMPILLAMDVLIVWRFRRTWDQRIILGLLPAAVLGLVLGSLTFGLMNADVIRLVIGLLAAFFVGQFLASRRATHGSRPTRRPVVWALGLLSGFSSFVAHAGGPPVKGYLLRQNLEKTWFVGTNTVFFFTLNVIKTIAYGATGTLSMTSLLTSVTLAPVLFVGVFIGARCHAYIKQEVFVKVVYGFLALTAAKLLTDSVLAFTR